MHTARSTGPWNCPLVLVLASALALAACSGDDSGTVTGSSGSAGTSPGTGGDAGSGGSAGSTGSSGSAGSTGSGGAGGSAGSAGAGVDSGASRDGAPTSDAAPCLPAGTIMVTGTYSFNGGPTNPSLTLCRGNTYTFAVNSSGHPFNIWDSMRNTPPGVTGNGAEMGNVVFVVPANAPDILMYMCSLHAYMTGAVFIRD